MDTLSEKIDEEGVISNLDMWVSFSDADTIIESLKETPETIELVLNYILQKLPSPKNDDSPNAEFLLDILLRLI